MILSIAIQCQHVVSFGFTDIATDDDRKELFKELRLMANVGDHPNIVNLIGACSRGGRSLKPPFFK